MIAAGSTCPYQGLQAFDVEDADRFFGRRSDIDACLEVLRRTNLLALVGPSGSGKSSLMRAGVGAALRARGTPSVAITPGSRPLEALSALAGAPTGAALLIDQFEELFSLCADVPQRQEFLRSLVNEAQGRSIVIALRADHLADLAAYSDFVRLVERGLYIVGGLGEEGLAQAIEAPARQGGLIIEAGLVDLLVREVKDDPGALPLLSHVLLETWRRREGNTLTVAGYRASGGIHGAVAQSAEALYAKVAIEHRHTLRDLILRLVTPGPLGEPVRSRVPRRMVATDHDRDQLIEKLVAARLVTSDDGALEISHEALARAWPRLRGWLDDDVEGQRMLHHLFAAADAWNSMDRPDSELYRGVRLARIRDWQTGSTTTLTDTEQAFLAASQQQAELEEHSAEERARVQARLIRRLRGVLTGAVVLLVLALAAGGVAAVQSNRAEDNAAEADASRLAAERDKMTALVRQASLRSEATNDVELSLLLAVAATKLDSSPESTDALARALSRNPALVRSTPLAAEDSTSFDLSPDGRRIATIDTRHHVRLVDATSGAVEEEAGAGAARGESDESRSIEFSPDGRLLAVGRTPLSRDPVALLDGETLAKVQPRLSGLPPADWRVADVAFSQDGRSLGVALQRYRQRGATLSGASLWVAVWRLDHPARPLLRRLPRGGDPDWASIALSPEGDSVYALPSRRVYDLTRVGGDQQFYQDEVGHSDGIGRAGGIAVSPNGRLLAFALGTLQGAVVMDVRTGGVVHRLAPDMTVSNVRFSRDGSRLMTTFWGSGRTTEVWDMRSGRVVAAMSLTDGSELAVDLNGEGDTVISLDWQGTVRRWDVTGSRRYLRRLPVRGPLPEFVDAGGACLVTPASGGEFVAYVNCGSSSERLDKSYLLLDVAGRRARLIEDAMTGNHFGPGSWREGPARSCGPTVASCASTTAVTASSCAPPTRWATGSPTWTTPPTGPSSPRPRRADSSRCWTPRPSNRWAARSTRASRSPRSRWAGTTGRRS